MPQDQRYRLDFGQNAVVHLRGRGARELDGVGHKLTYTELSGLDVVYLELPGPQYSLGIAACPECSTRQWRKHQMRHGFARDSWLRKPLHAYHLQCRLAHVARIGWCQ